MTVREERRLARRLMVGIGMLAVVGCSNGAIPGPQPKTSDFDVMVGPGANPVYTWSGGGAASLRVVKSDNFAEISWLIITENAAGDPVNNITSPVTHGTAPTGAEVSVNNEPNLQIGAAYEVTVARADGSAGFAVFVAGANP